MRSGSFKSLPIRLNIFALTVGALLTAILYSGFSKPIWIDEFLHFALGATSTTETITILGDTLGDGVNWGQTPTLLLMNHLMLDSLGSNLWVLRAPSIIAGFIMMLIAIYFLRSRGISTVFQWVLLGAFVAQSQMMYYVGESRPYMLMASSSVALLAFYSFNARQRRSVIGIAIGIYGVILGPLFHPYWLMFLVIAVFFGIFIKHFEGNRNRGLKSLAVSTAPIWTVVGISLYGVTAFLSWALNSGSPLADPFEFVESPLGVLRTAGSTHFQLLLLPPELAVPNLPTLLDQFNFPRILIFILILTVTACLIFQREYYRDLVLPTVLLGLALMSTMVLVFLSLAQTYWIVQRQWLGGMALATIATVWMIAILFQNRPRPRLNFASVIALTATIVIALNAGQSIVYQYQAIRTHEDVFMEFQLDTRSESELIVFAQNSGSWEYVANVNAARGGPVWRGFARYYGVE